jgi:hypothetical protein
MAIAVRRVDGLFEVEIILPHGCSYPRKSPEPLARCQMIKALRERGCDPTDI